MMKKLILLIFSVVFCIGLYSQKSNKVFMKSFYDASAYMYEDNYSVALDYWKKAEDKDPENPNVWYNMGVCLKNSSKDRELAVEYLTKALDYANPNYVSNDHTERTAPIDCYVELGIALRMVGKYDESTEMLNNAKSVAATNGRDDLLTLTEEELVITENAKKIMSQKSCSRIDVYNIGSVINSEYSDHSPIITCDGQTLYFTSKRPNAINSEEDEKIYVSHKKDNGEWSTPDMLPSPINTKGKNESVVSVSRDGNQLYFFRSGSSLQGGLFVSEKTDKGAWGKPKQLSSDINTKYRESHVAIAPDGNSMYFTSDRPGGFGGLDIYVIKKLPNGKWSEPQLLPAEVNTPRDEEYPFVHPNGSTLYFNSKGHDGVGGYDVFYSKINDDGSYSKAENMCSPINTADNDICYSLGCDGKTAYIAAIREDTNGEYDIYVINDGSTDENLIVYTGKVKYADNATPKGMSVWVKNKTTGEDLGSFNVDENGEYLCDLQPKSDYSLTFSKNGETFAEINKTPTNEEAENFKRMGSPIALDDVVLPHMNKNTEVEVTEKGELTAQGSVLLDDVIKTAKDMKDESREMVINIEHDENSISKDSQQMKSVLDYLSNSGAVTPSEFSYNNKPSDKNVYNVKVVYGTGAIASNDPKRTLSDTVEIFNIYFDFDRSDITDKHKENLNKLSEYMKDNPGCQIEVGGHTDNVGTDEYNMLLSGRRARAVKDYLVANGVKQDKVIEKKYGEGSPIASNNTSNTRKYNRRVAFKVLEQGSEKYLKIVEENVSNNSNSSKASANGKVYRVQLFALTKSKPVESFGIPNLKVREINGVYKYYLGDFNSKSEASKILETIKDKYPEAIVLESF